MIFLSDFQNMRYTDFVDGDFRVFGFGSRQKSKEEGK
jgi:hypothetical protein